MECSSAITQSTTIPRYKKKWGGKTASQQVGQTESLLLWMMVMGDGGIIAFTFVYPHAASHNPGESIVQYSIRVYYSSRCVLSPTTGQRKWNELKRCNLFYSQAVRDCFIRHVKCSYAVASSTSTSNQDKPQRLRVAVQKSTTILRAIAKRRKIHTDNVRLKWPGLCSMRHTKCCAWVMVCCMEYGLFAVRENHDLYLRVCNHKKPWDCWTHSLHGTNKRRTCEKRRGHRPKGPKR